MNLLIKLAVFLAHILCNRLVLSKFAESQGFLSMKINKSGFHREIVYNIKFSAPLKVCDILLVQHIPNSVFVDSDQLNTLKKLNKLKSFVPSYINVELPTHKADPFSIYLFESVRKNVNLTLPLHFRYHLPSEKKFNRVEIESPTLYSSCSQGRPQVQLPCVNSSEIVDFFKLKDASLCNWTEIELSSAPITLSFLIPIGNINSYNFVLPITILVSWLACLFLTCVIIKKARQISKKIL